MNFLLKIVNFTAMLALILPIPSSAAEKFLGQANKPNNWQPTMLEVLAFEKKIAVPSGFSDFNGRERYYTGTYEGGRKKILAFYLTSNLSKLIDDDEKLQPAHIHIMKMDSFPQIWDAGCGVMFVDVNFEVARVEPRCQSIIRPGS